MFAVLFSFACNAFPAFAQTPMSGEEFDAFTKGKTFSYLQSGQAYGAEQYRSGRRVTWSFGTEECVDGTWYEPEAGLICFVGVQILLGVGTWKRTGRGETRK